MDNVVRELRNEFGEQRIRIQESLEQYFPTQSFIASVFLTVNNKDELQKAVMLLRRSHAHFLILDLESEKVEKELTPETVVIKNDAKRFDILARKGKMQSQQLITDYALVEAESGASFNGLVRFTIHEGLGGLEYGIGTPGSVGKVIAQEKEIREYLLSHLLVQSVKILTPENTVSEIEFSKLESELLVLSIIFKLQGEDKKILWLKAQRAAEERKIEF